MQAIEVRYHGPTNRLGTRYIAECAAGRLVFAQDNALNPDENATEAAVRLIQRLGWHESNRGFLCRGSLKSGSWVFVFSYGDPLGTGFRAANSETVNYQSPRA